MSQVQVEQRSDLRSLDVFLIAALRRDDAALLASAAALGRQAWSLLVPACERHGVTPWVTASLRSAGVDVPTAQAEELSLRLRAHAMSSLRITSELQRLTTLLDDAAVPWLTFKGPVLERFVYPDGRGRVFGDLDVMVSPAALRRAFAVLEAGGAAEYPRDWTLVRVEGGAETSWVLPLGTHLDLHWGVLGRPSIAESFRLDTESFLQRRRRVQLGSMVVPTLDATDQFAHLCVHAVLSGGSLLKHVLDVFVTAENDPPDWDELAVRAESSGTALPISVMLQRVRTVFPDSPYRLDVGSKTWRWFMRAHDRVNPPVRSYGRHLARDYAISATRSDARGSARTLARTLNAEVVHPVLHDPTHPWRRALHIGSHAPRAVLPPPAHDQDERDRFLRELEMGAIED